MNFDFIPAWANTIAQVEGFNAPGSRPARNHNPGDLKFAGQVGAIGADRDGFAVFPDDVTGFQALYRQLQKYVTDYPNDTILDITAHYLGQSTPTRNAQGDAFKYAAAVASGLGVDTGTTLAELASGAPGVPAPPNPITGAPDTGVLDASVFSPLDFPPTEVTGSASGAQLTTGEILGGLAVIGLVLYLAWS